MDHGHDLVVRTIREHASALLATARRHSLCADDAHDAYQRALEIFLRRAGTLDAEGAVRWLHVVVKHEARAVRRARLQLVGAEEADLDARAADGQPDAEERVLRFDRVARSAEALQRLKPQELTALWLKAQGLSYSEIAERQSWTYTKVNRCLTEGRRAFLERYAGIEAGEECRRWAPVVSALVDGEATAEQIAAARPHLRRCSACRATVRELRLAGPRMAGVLPGAGLVGAGAGPVGAGRLESLARGLEAAGGAVHDRLSAWGVGLHERVSAWGVGLHERVSGWGVGLHERVSASAVKLQLAGEAASVTKVAAVAASAAALAGGGAATVGEIGGHGHGRAAVERRADGSAASSPGAVTRPASFLAAPTTTAAGPADALTPAARRVAAEFGAGGEFPGTGRGRPVALRDLAVGGEFGSAPRAGAASGGSGSESRGRAASGEFGSGPRGRGSLRAPGRADSGGGSGRDLVGDRASRTASAAPPAGPRPSASAPRAAAAEFARGGREFAGG